MTSPNSMASDRTALASAPAGAAAAKRLEVMWHDYPILQQFHTKHALGAKAAPSCLCCGQQTHLITRPIAVQHMELPAIVICKPCKQAADGAGAQRPATVTPDADRKLIELRDAAAACRELWDHSTIYRLIYAAEAVGVAIPAAAPAGVDSSRGETFCGQTPMVGKDEHA